MNEFRILQNCSICGEICGEGFDSEYKLLKHLSKFHPLAEKAGRVGGGEDSFVCGHHINYKDS